MKTEVSKQESQPNEWPARWQVEVSHGDTCKVGVESAWEAVPSPLLQRRRRPGEPQVANREEIRFFGAGSFFSCF